MPRKFALGRRRKNEYWKKKPKHVCTLILEHLPLTQDSISVLTPDECTPPALSKSEESLVVSLPLDILMEVNIPALVLLRKRIQALSVLWRTHHFKRERQSIYNYLIVNILSYN